MNDINEELESLTEDFAKAQSGVNTSIEGTVFDPANFAPVVIIQLTRIYDALMALLGEQNPEAASNLDALHSVGKFLASSPAYTEVTEK